MESSNQLVDIVYERWPVISAALAACAIALILPMVLQTIRLSSVPVVGKELGGTERRRQAYLVGAKKLYIDGYRKVCKLSWIWFLFS